MRAVAVVANERIGCTGIRACDDTERQAEEGREFALPIAEEARGRHDEDALDQAAGFHLADVEPRHDGLTRTGVIGEKEAQRKLLEYVLVDSDPLVGQRIDLRDLRGERRVEHVAEAQPLTLCQGPDGLRRTGEIETGHRGCRLNRRDDRVALIHPH